MRILFLTYLLFGFFHSYAQETATADRVARYLEDVRDQRALLAAFFAAMPKGGDIHHHFEGSIYPENLVDAIVREDYWIDTTDLTIRPGGALADSTGWSSMAEWATRPGFAGLRRRLLQKWSVLDYQFNAADPPDVHFFGAFPAFIPAIPAATDESLLRMKERAIAENVQYLETIFLPFQCPEAGLMYPESMDAELRSLQEQRDAETLFRLFDKLFEEMESGQLDACAAEHNAGIALRHDSLGIDGDGFHLRYQNYVLRVFPPTRVFADLAVNFRSAAESPLVVSVNIVAPEHDPVALADYWLHMQMYRYFGRRFPLVKKALHAGELVPGLTAPEHLTHHVRDAVTLAGADRIGHGVDIPFEEGSQALLRQMAEKPVPVEINLASSAYILSLPPANHSLPLYLEQGVPVVIATDDAGVLRTSLTMQYVLLAEAFPDIGYADIKQMVYDSIAYSFIEEPHVKEAVSRQLESAFANFEEEWSKKVAP